MMRKRAQLLLLALLLDLGACASKPPAPTPDGTADLRIEKLPPQPAKPSAPVAVAVAPSDKGDPFRGTCGQHDTGNPAPLLTSVRAGTGDVTLVYFWATWCAPCQRDFPAYQKIYAKYGDRGLAIAAVSVDDELGGVMDFAHRWNATFPIGWDGHHQDADCWHIGTMPTTAVVDRMGIIRFWHDGSHDGEAAKIAEEIESLL